MTATERIRLALERHPDRDDRYISKVSRATLSDVRAVKAGGEVPDREAQAQPAGQLVANATVIPVEDIKRHYDTFAQIMEVIRDLPPGGVITEQELRGCIQSPDPLRFKRTVEAHEKDLEPYRLLVKYRSSEPRYHYGKPEVIRDLRLALERP